MREGRHELKYALPRARRAELLALGRPHTVPGAFSRELGDDPELRLGPGEPGAHGYRVHSLYLDTRDLQGYGRRLDRVDIRNRVRVRTYGRPGERAPVFLEAKRKLHRLVVKHRVRVGGTRAWAAGRHQAPWVDAVAALPAGLDRRRARRWVAAASGMEPVCATHYLREVYEDGDVRMTLDHAVRASHADDPRVLRRQGERALLPPDWFVLELKFNGDMPGWMRTLVRTMRLSSEPVSKFALGVVRTVRHDEPPELAAVTPSSLLRAWRRRERRAPGDLGAFLDGRTDAAIDELRSVEAPAARGPTADPATGRGATTPAESSADRAVVDPLALAAR